MVRSIGLPGFFPLIELGLIVALIMHTRASEVIGVSRVELNPVAVTKCYL